MYFGKQHNNSLQGELSINTLLAGILTFSDVQGAVVAMYNMQKGINTISLAASLSSGMYVARFTDNEGKIMINRKLVLTK